MKTTSDVAEGLLECLKYERTLEDCYGLYSSYFGRWRICRLRDWFCSRGEKARARKKELIERICQLDTTPDNKRYDVELDDVDEAGDIKKVVGYFLKTLSEAREAYEQARKAAKDNDDTVSARLLGRGKTGIEDDLWRVEAKERRIQLVGAELYIAHHMHTEK
jgi:bacterioferritin (cytochrome b1)